MTDDYEQTTGHEITCTAVFSGQCDCTPTAATDATRLDKSRRYLVPVARLDLPSEPDLVHLSVYKWLPQFEAWATGLGLCGRSTRQGALSGGTTVTCSDCLAYQPEYERMLAPGYRPEDDDPGMLRQRAESAERQVAQARALVAKWREVAAERGDAVILVGVAADILTATMDGFNDLLREAAR